MKKLLFLLFVTLVYVTGYAQTPQYNTSGGSTNNVFPFSQGSSGNNKVQWLFYPTDFSAGMPSAGTITNVYFRAASGNTSYTLTDFKVQLGPSSLTAFPSAAWQTGLTTVYSMTGNITVTTTSGGWFSVALQTPYAYSNVSNLIVEASVSNNTGISIPQNNTGSNGRIWGNTGGAAGVSFGSGRVDFGVDISTGPPCPSPTGANASNVLSTSATLSWNAVSGSVGYDYIIDQNATVQFPNTPIPTSATSVNATGLTPSTTYYLHVRNKCSAINFSPWVNLMFTTLPPCKPPVNFKVLNLQTTSATISWGKWPSAITYDYVVDQTRADPGGTTGAVNTVDTFANLTNLTENTWYYVHIRSLCAANEKSTWSLDSFITPIPCRAPSVHIDHINTSQAVAYWEPVPSAMWYEYAITQMSLPPVNGTKYNFTSIHTAALNDGEAYYIHVRCSCVSVGIQSLSPWASASFATWPVGISNVNGNDALLEAYPNPVKDILLVNFNAPHGGGVLSLSDITGKTVYSRNVESSTTKLEVDMKGLPAGLYMMQYKAPGHTEKLKVTKQ